MKWKINWEHVQFTLSGSAGIFGSFKSSILFSNVCILTVELKLYTFLVKQLRNQKVNLSATNDNDQSIES